MTFEKFASRSRFEQNELPLCVEKLLIQEDRKISHARGNSRLKESKGNFKFIIRNFVVEDLREVYKLLIENRPHVGLNSRYTYFLLAKDFSDTCVVAEYKNRIVGFSSGYISPSNKDTFSSWEAVVREDFRGNNLQKLMLLHQIADKRVRYFEGTFSPSNEASKRSFRGLAQLLETKCEECMLFSGDDFENDGHEPAILFRVGPFLRKQVIRTMLISENQYENLERMMFTRLNGNASNLECYNPRETYIASSKLKMSHASANIELLV